MLHRPQRGWGGGSVMMRSSILGTGKGKAQRSILGENVWADHSSGFFSIQGSSAAPFSCSCWLTDLGCAATIFQPNWETKCESFFSPTLHPTFVLQTVVLVLWWVSLTCADVNFTTKPASALFTSTVPLRLSFPGCVTFLLWPLT